MASAALLLGDVAKALYEYSKTQTAEEIQPFCMLQNSLQKVVGKLEGLPHNISQQPWARGLAAAKDRFDEAFGEQGRQWIKTALTDKGPKDAYAYINSCNCLSEGLRHFKPILAQASFLQELKTPENTQDLSELSKRIRGYITTRSLDLEAMDFLMPDHVAKVEEYCSAIANNVLSHLRDCKKKMKAAAEKLDKYRLAAAGKFATVDDWLLVAVCCTVRQLVIVIIWKVRSASEDKLGFNPPSRPQTFVV